MTPSALSVRARFARVEPDARTPDVCSAFVRALLTKVVAPSILPCWTISAAFLREVCPAPAATTTACVRACVRDCHQQGLLTRHLAVDRPHSTSMPQFSPRLGARRPSPSPTPSPPWLRLRLALPAPAGSSLPFEHGPQTPALTTVERPARETAAATTENATIHCMAAIFIRMPWYVKISRQGGLCVRRLRTTASK
jgi:hypothetical protein